MTVDFYGLDDFVRTLPDTALTQIGEQLTAPMQGRDWRAIGAQLGYTMARMDAFVHRHNPGYELLRDWSTKDGSTIRVLRSKLESIERYDVIVLFNDIMQNPMTLDVVIHDLDCSLNSGSGYSLTPKITGRKELWEGLLPCLENHVTEVVRRRRYVFFNLRGLLWQNQCCNYRGQQVDIDVRLQDTSPKGSPPGFRVRQVATSWHLISATQLRYTFTEDAAQGGRKSDGPRLFPGDTTFKQEAQTKGSGRLVSLAGCKSSRDKGPLTEASKHPTQKRASDLDAEGLEKEVNERIEDSPTRETTTLPFGISEQPRAFETPNQPFAIEATKQPFAIEATKQPFAIEATKQALVFETSEQPESFNLDLKSFDPGELSEETTLKTAQVVRLDLYNTEIPHGTQETDMAIATNLSTICLRSGSLPDKQGPGIRDQEELSSVTVDMAPSSPAAGPGEGAEQQLVELRESDPPLENDDSVSDGSVKEEALEQLQHRFRRRHVYCLPKQEIIRNLFPELMDLPGFHPKLKHKISLIHDVMQPFEKTDGWYLIRVFVSDENLDKVHLALTVTHKSKLKHFNILRYPDSNPRRYFLFSRDYEATSIADLIDHYKIHPLVPGSLSTNGTNLPRLVNPVLKDSSNY